ncbi:MAG: VCBS repeat-containing protein, partial [Nitrospirae bacterium]
MSRNRVIRLLRKLMPTVAVFVVLLPTVCFSAEREPLEGLIKETLSFFSPLSMSVDERRGEELVLSGKDLDRIKPGMRVRIYRPGKPFRHPVTREIVGRMDVEVGLAEVVGMEGQRAVAKIISGDPNKGDEVRIGSTVIPVLFFQSPGLDYYLGDDYFRKLKKTGRFRVYEAPIEDLTLEQLREMASEKGATVILTVDEGKSDKESVQMVQRLYWGDGSLIKVSNINVSRDYISGLKAGTEFLAGIGEEPLLTYKLSYGAERLTSGDLNGDGKWELLLVSGNRIMIYSYDVDLSELLEYQISDADMIIWVDTIDLDGDGKAEVCLTYLKGEVNSERDSDAIVTEVKMPDAFVSQILRYES